MTIAQHLFINPVSRVVVPLSFHIICGMLPLPLRLPTERTIAINDTKLPEI